MFSIFCLRAQNESRRIYTVRTGYIRFYHVSGYIQRRLDAISRGFPYYALHATRHAPRGDEAEARMHVGASPIPFQQHVHSYTVSWLSCSVFYPSRAYRIFSRYRTYTVFPLESRISSNFLTLTYTAAFRYWSTRPCRENCPRHGSIFAGTTVGLMPRLQDEYFFPATGSNRAFGRYTNCHASERGRPRHVRSPRETRPQRCCRRAQTVRTRPRFDAVARRWSPPVAISSLGGYHRKVHQLRAGNWW